MNRKDTTKFLGELLENTRLSGMGKYYAKEVSLDYGTSKVRRVDYIQFVPPRSMYISDIEKGIFVCYEIKSCKEDVYSGNGLNFIGEKNYIVTTMECYKALQEDMREGKLDKHILECNPESNLNFGIIVATPWTMNNTTEEEYAEFQNPTPLSRDIKWQLTTMIPCREGRRNRSLTELLFLMLRSKN